MIRYHNPIVVLFTALLIALFACFAPIAQLVGSAAIAQTNASTLLLQEAPTSQSQAELSALVDRASTIFVGRVVDVQSFWNHDHTIIESDTSIQVHLTILGAPVSKVTVRTEGGFLPNENIGMGSPHAATFQPGEDVLLFTKESKGIQRVVYGAAGKYQIFSDTAWSSEWNHQIALPTLYQQIGLLAQRRGLAPHRSMPKEEAPSLFLPIWQQMNREVAQRKWTSPHTVVPFTVNINTRQADGPGGSRAEFLNTILIAANTWSTVPETDFLLSYAGETTATATSYNHLNEVVFMHKGTHERAATAQFWYTSTGTIIEADIWINDDFAWNATGVPSNSELDLQSAVLHELGHWLVLGHMSDPAGVMYPKIATGVVRTVLQQDDIEGIRAVYPCSQSTCNSE